MSGPFFSGGRPTFLAYLIAFGLLIAAPLALFAAKLTHDLAAERRAAVEIQVLRDADEAIAFLDRAVAEYVAALKILATSRSLRAGDYGPLYVEALSASDILGGSVFLTDIEGRRILDTRVPFGTMLASDPAQGAALPSMRSNSPAISNLHRSSQTDEPVIAIAVPVHLGSDVVGALGIELHVDVVYAKLVGSGIEPQQNAAIPDREGLIIARSNEHHRFVGAPLAGFPDLVGAAGVWTGINMVGTEIFGAWERSETTGFVVGVAVPMAELQAPLRTGQKAIAALALVAVTFGTIGAVFFGRRIARATSALTLIARDPLENARIDAAAATIAETDLIARTMREAISQLAERDRALAEANAQLEQRVARRTEELRVTLENMDQGLIMIDAAGRASVYNSRAVELLGLNSELLDRAPTVDEIRASQIEAGDFADKAELARAFDFANLEPGIADIYERVRPNGTVLEVRTVPVAGGGFVRTYTDVTMRKRTEERIADLARRDPLTGLANRLLLREALADRLSTADARSPAALLYLDLDRFKTVNDTLGHPAGDALLAGVADRIRAILRRGDLFARLGGDEFAILCGGPCNAAEAEVLAGRITEALAQPFDIDGKVVRTSTSIGIAFAPNDGVDADELVKAADLALYRAKASGRGVHRIYESAMEEEARERRALELDLGKAVTRGELEVHYQPIAATTSGDVVCCEALLRWRHPERGLVPPSMFIPIAEESRQIGPLGRFVLETACRDALAWPEDIRIAVNVSTIQLRDPSFPAEIAQILKKTGLEAKRLELEITETAVLDEGAEVTSSLVEIRRLGVRLAMDDFGTGYSSLSTLRRYAFDKLKIDGSFVRDIERPETAAIVRAMVGLGARLGMTITAECVETFEQKALLEREGCTEIQGWLVGRPMQAHLMAQFLSEFRAQRGRAA
jgi:diguanylate cyclase (GGDEF)-like protein